MKQIFTKLLHVRTALALLLTTVLTLTAQTAWADSWPEYITDVVLVGGTESEAQTAKSGYSGYTWCSQRLNEGGDIIYIGYKTASRVNTNGGYITDFIIIDAGAGTQGHNPPSSLTFQGRTYYLCPAAGGDYFVNSNHGNLTSQAANGWNMYLYYTKANFSDKRAVSSITITKGEDTKSESIDCYNKDGSLIEADISLNRGVSGTPFVYMHISTVDKTNRPKTDPVMASGLVYNGQEQMLVASMGTTFDNTYQLYFREIGGNQYFYENTSQFTKATNADTYNVEYYAESNDYGNQSATKTHQVTIAKSPNSGAYVTCSNYLEGTAPVPELKGTNLSSGTVTYKYSTSQNGTYTTTKPSAAGTYWVKATIAGDSNCYEYTTAATSFNIVYNWELHNSGDSEADAYIIYNKDQLDLLAERVNTGSGDDYAASGYSGKYFRLGANITYSNTSVWDNTTSTENNYTPIGNSNNKKFKGHFDGKEYTVSGIRISASNYYNGLFGNLDGATVKNVILSDARIMSTAQYCGGIAGYCSSSTITNCWVKSNVCVGKNNYVGGIVGEIVTGTIMGCRSEAMLKADSNNRERYGGIAGTVQGQANVKHCIVVGASVPNTNYHGAIAGRWIGNYTNNYYINCNVAGVADATDVGREGSDRNGARKAVAINTADGVTITPTGTATTYTVSGITAYEGNNGIGFGGKLYAAEGESVNLDITYTSPYEGFNLEGYTDGVGQTPTALTYVSGNTWTLTMPATTAYITPAGQNLWGETDGTGRDGSTAEKAFLITTPAGLDLLAKKVNGTDGYEAKNYSGTYFKLGADIVYDESTENNFTPIGDDSHYFSGTFDGQGYTISGIWINKPNSYNIGIFGFVDSEEGTVKNLIVSNSSIVGRSRVGVIAGRLNFGSTIENCHVGNDVTLSGNLYVGGIAGNSSEGTIKGCTSAATIIGTKNAGSNARHLGGVVGATLLSSSPSVLIDNIFTGAITGNLDKYIGAIVGQNNSGTLTNNYHTCSGMGGVGNEGDATNSDQDGAQFAYEFPTATGAMGNATFTYGTGDYTGITAYEHGLAYNGKYYYPNVWGGSGTEGDPYVIVNTEGLDKLAADVNAGNKYSGTYFKLGADIVYDESKENNFTPIGDGSHYFRGTFDGQGYTISGIWINKPNSYNIGIFGFVDSQEGTVKNLIVSNSRFVGSTDVGVIAGYLRSGTIENCHVGNDVTLSGNFYVGGIACYNDNGNIKGCTCAATIIGTIDAGMNACYLGGVVGATSSSYSSSLLIDNIFTGAITGDLDKYIGAIVGKNKNGTLTNNYHTCSGMGSVGNEGDATNSDQDGAQFAVSSTSKPATFGDATATYGTGTYQGITAYGSNGLEYGGKYYWHVDNLMVIDNDGTENSSAIVDNQTRTVVLSGRTLYKDGGWNTICLPFSVDLDADGCPLAGAIARKLYEASINGSTLNLNFDNPVTTLDAGTPYIIMWEKADDYVDDDAHNIVAPVFTNVTVTTANNNFTTGSGDTKVQFIGTYDKVTFNDQNRSILFVGAENTLYYPNGEGVTTIGACRAYFKIGEDGAGARQITGFNFNFDGGETTAVFDLNNNEQIINITEWYTLDGRKLDSKPTQKGVYINNGRKVVIK